MKIATRLPSNLATELLRTSRDTLHTRVYLRQVSNSVAEASVGYRDLNKIQQ